MALFSEKKEKIMKKEMTFTALAAALLAAPMNYANASASEYAGEDSCLDKTLDLRLKVASGYRGLIETGGHRSWEKFRLLLVELGCKESDFQKSYLGKSDGTQSVMNWKAFTELLRDESQRRTFMTEAGAGVVAFVVEGLESLQGLEGLTHPILQEDDLKTWIPLSGFVAVGHAKPSDHKTKVVWMCMDVLRCALEGKHPWGTKTEREE